MRLVWSLAVLITAGAQALPPDRAISQYVRRSWTVEQGLPHGTVRGLAQTSDGYLWLATYEGLVRFNGEKFRIFDEHSSPGLPNSSILTICRGRDDTLWLGTVAGLVRFRNGVFDRIARAPGVAEELVNAVVETKDGTIWAGTWGGLSRVSGGRMQRVALPGKSNLINALLQSGDGALWIATTRGGLLRRSGETYKTYTIADGLPSDTILTLLDDGAGGLYAGTDAGLAHLSGGRIQTIAGIPADQITALRRDRDGNLWAGTYANGLFRLSGSTVSSYTISEGLLNPTVRGIFEDDEGSLWVGTNRGLEQLRAGAFVTWNKSQGLSDDFARAVFEDRDGAVWAGTANGLNRIQNGVVSRAADPRLARAYVLSIAQSADGTLWFGTSYGLYRSRNGVIAHLTTADGLLSNGIRAIYADRHDDIWLATDSGVNRVRRDGTIENFLDRGLSTDYAIAVGEGPDGRLWIATGLGLAEFDGTRFRLHSAPHGLLTNRLFTLDIDSDGTLWIGTDGEGLLRYRDGMAGVINDKNGLPHDKILSIADDGEGNLWFGTVRGAFKAAKTELHAIAAGTGSVLTPRLYDENDGLGSRQCNGSGWPAALRSRDGRVWFATANGVSALTPRKAAVVRRAVHKPAIERVMLDGKVAPLHTLSTIPPGVQRIDLEFTGLAFVTPERLRFRHRLEGYDDKWVDAGTNRVASYTNLPAGSYRFVLASSRDGRIWQPAFLPIELKPHFYERKWFIALCALVFMALILGIHFARLHFSRERERTLAKIVEERTRQISEEKERTELALRDAEEARREAERQEHLAEEANRAKSTFLATTSHELRTPLNAIIGFSDILIQRTTNELDARYARFLHNIHSSGAYLLGIINNILDLSKIEAGRMDLQPETIILDDTVHGVCAVMKGVTTLRRITIELQIPNDLPKFEADPIQIKQILYNLIANAVKFSPEDSTVIVSARHLWPVDSPIGENAIEIQVTDRGIGIDPKDHAVIFQEFRQAHEPGTQRPEGTGLGLALVKRFAEMHGGTVRVESAVGEGSTFVVVLPCRQPAAPKETRVADERVGRAE